MNRERALELLSSGTEGISTWNQWREQQDTEKLPDLSGLDFSGCDLTEANLSKTNLSKAKFETSNCQLTFFQGADLSHANFIAANLHQANLQRTNCRQASFILANLTDADLAGAEFRYAFFQRSIISGSRLPGASFLGATIDEVSWSNLDLSSDVDLSQIEYWNPSSIGLDTILISQEFPDEFLLGCGIPETLLEYVKALPASLQPIQYYSCFISYSHKNEEFAQRLHGRLRQAGLRVWYAPEDMKSGRKIHQQIDQAIRLHDRLLLVLSEASMKSEWVATEIYKARQREKKEGKQVLFPIRLVDFDRIQDWECFDADTGKDMAREIREYFIPDFSDWKNHDKFEKAFDRLLSDLKKSAGS